MPDIDPTPETPVTVGDRLAWWRGEQADQAAALLAALADQHAALLAALADQHAALLAALADVAPGTSVDLTAITTALGQPQDCSDRNVIQLLCALAGAVGATTPIDITPPYAVCAGMGATYGWGYVASLVPYTYYVGGGGDPTLFVPASIAMQGDTPDVSGVVNVGDGIYIDAITIAPTSSGPVDICVSWQNVPAGVLVRLWVWPIEGEPTLDVVTTAGSPEAGCTTVTVTSNDLVVPVLYNPTLTDVGIVRLWLINDVGLG